MRVLKDVYEQMKDGTSYESLMDVADSSKRGCTYEAIVKILHLFKMLPKEFLYSDILNVKHVNDILDSGIVSGPDGSSDITFWNMEKEKVCVSIKHTKDFDPIHEGGINQLVQQGERNLAYVCLDRTKVVDRLKHKKMASYRNIYIDILKTNRLLDEHDIKIAYENFKNSIISIDYVEKHYLHNHHNPITIQYHQQLALDKFVANMPREPNHLLAYVPRTGKSIIILLMVRWLLDNNLSDRILLITPICKTIESFEDAIKKYADFSDIPVYVIKSEKQPVPLDFKGLVISSIQYFKVGLNKTVEGYQTVISDEAHIGTYTVNSLDNIFRASTVRYRIFASGTPCGTQKNFHIPQTCVYTWTNVHSKLVLSPDGRRALGVPSDVDLEPYKQVPTQVYMPVSISSKTLEEYNENHPSAEKGFSWQSILALKNPKDADSGFVIENRPHGTNFLKKMLRTIINDDPNDESSIYSRTRVLRSIHGSRNFSDMKELVIMFLPTHTNEGTIDNIQRALVTFCETHGVWDDWKILYDNSQTPAFDIDKVMESSDDERFVLFLGSKNTVGVTYQNCDLTVHLDTSKSTDLHIQKLARAGTGQPGKTIYVNADYNIQRKTETIASVLTMSREILKTEDNLSTAESLHNSKTFIIDCGDIGYEMVIRELDSTYDVKHMIESLKWDTHELDKIINNKWSEQECEDFEGTGTDIPTGERDPPERNPTDPREPSDPKHTPEEVEEVVNKTLQLLQNFIIPINGILAAKYNEKNTIAKYPEEFMTLLCDKEPGIKKQHQYIVMEVCSTCRHNNKQVIENIEQRFIDARRDFREYHELIYKHLKPSDEERKQSAEIHTPPILIREMLDKIPSDFWNEPREVLDPCCGKGGFLVELFRRFDEGLTPTYPKKKQRHRIIIEICLHFWDISPLNVFLTQEILRVMSDGVSTSYNSRVGNSLSVITDRKFCLVVGNPPYQAVSKSGNSKGGGNNLYTKFIYYADKHLKQNGYLLYINPPTYFGPGRSNNKNDMSLRKDILDNYYYHYINLQECSKYFNVGSKFLYYLIQKNSNKNDNIEILCKYNNMVYKSNLHQDLLIRDYLPYLLTKECLNILDKIKNNNSDKLAMFHSPDNRSDKKHVSKERSTEHKYPIQATGVQIVYSTKKCKNQNNKKILMSRSGYLKPFYDNGIIGVGGDCFACLVRDENEGLKIIKLLNSKLYKFYIETNKWSGFHNKEVLQDLPNISNKLNDINDENIYGYFNITKDEIELIETTV